MQNMSDIKRRIDSIGQTRQITKAMHLISSVKMRKAVDRYEANALYIDRIRTTIKDILLHCGNIEHPFLEQRDGGRIAYLVIAGDKGMCGAYNHNVLKLAQERIEGAKQSFVFTVGHMATEYFNHRHRMVDVEFLHTAQDPALYNARQISEVLVDLYSQGMIDGIEIVFTHMKSTLLQEPQALTLLPLGLETLKDAKLESDFSGTVQYEPSPAVVFDTLVPQYVIGVVYATLVQAFASEQCARMRAMSSATDNADEMIGRLQMEYRRARQAAITNEINEIMGGTNAVRRTDGRK
ncbi:MAG: ATP synthase F1 subunit gamma [Eubacteriales bacterium]|nr:ATP synthase F1 subunit gamma [Eubacteriales bacterium]